MNNERSLKLNKPNTFKNFYKKIKKKKNLIHLLKKIKAKKIIQYIWCINKRQCFTQYFGINKDYLDVIADRNPNKDGFFTPNFKIKIVKENYSRKLNPDYYLVLPWHFKKEI